MKRTDLDKARTFVGTCPDMCPEKERYMRETRSQLSIFEVVPGTDQVEPRGAGLLSRRCLFITAAEPGRREGGCSCDFCAKGRVGVREQPHPTICTCGVCRWTAGFLRCRNRYRWKFFR